MKSEDTFIRIDEVLQKWAEWHRTQDLVDVGYPKTAAGFFSNGLKTWDDLCSSTDNATMATIDACVTSLPPPQAAAIERAYGLCAIYRFPRGNYQDCLENAMVALSVSFRAKGVEL
jgi:hypothetical protein